MITANRGEESVTRNVLFFKRYLVTGSTQDGDASSAMDVGVSQEAEYSWPSNSERQDPISNNLLSEGPHSGIAPTNPVMSMCRLTDAEVVGIGGILCFRTLCCLRPCPQERNGMLLTQGAEEIKIAAGFAP
ncbi:hypothetical protein NDU88_003770 [Pleurodeles waltl]|uniref:Uncharacterized protein n=1 Tax=Pleurodeles waltl TaxID=8319 RepID=A0AAV7W335_PLEWA|nr:hypothetical protein NDU88_003770 [Pleurodeles waltl]